MLYIFHVDTGTMMTFDIGYALQSVMSLKIMIEDECQIPANKQVLLVSGGEVLRPDAKVGSYSAGTDTNPIYMFSKSIIESSEPPKSSLDYGFDVDLSEQVDKCQSMPVSSNTVLYYAQLAQRFWEEARKNTHACEKLVHDQHLQQQGWAAVVANMEDVTLDFHARAEDFEIKFREQLSKKDEYVELLNKFNDVLETLASIPILPALRLNAVSNPFSALDELHGESESYDDEEIENEENLSGDDEDSRSSKGMNVEGDESGSSREDREIIKRSQISRNKSNQNTKEALTLLHWINIKESQESLKHVAEYCQSAMEIFDGNTMPNLQKEVHDALKSANQSCMKRINGLEDRLSGLERLMCEARRIEQEQRDLALASQKHQGAVSMGDQSILRVICESLIKQLQNMLRNHQRLCDMRRRCVVAKRELAVNLYHRLQWIVYVENRMFETDSRLMFYHRSLARLKRHLAVVSQLHRAPRLFCTAVHEIVRRRKFSQAFLSWASDLACRILTIQNEEVMRRRNFHTLFSGHFLGDLFPGTDDLPPPFATQAPKIFDADLPKLTQSDIDILTSRLPHLTPEIPSCDITPAINFFKLRSESQEKSEERPIVDERIAAIIKESDRGCESETDTEEFEKVGQSPIERGGGVMQLPAAPVRTDASITKEDNMDSKPTEVHKLKEIISTLCNICNQSVSNLKCDLTDIKSNILDHKAIQNENHMEVLTSWKNFISENSIREREVLQRLTVDHELELNDIKQTLVSKDEHVLFLEENILVCKKECAQMVEKHKIEIEDLQNKIKFYGDLVLEQNKKLEEAEIVKQKALKELQDKMIQENKAEVESLRSRFRLVTLTSMDRSPSESSLEKIERTDMIEISNHNAILLQTQVDMEEKKEEAIRTALKVRDEEWNIKLKEEIEQVKNKFETEKQLSFKETMKRILDEKERQLELSRERESVLLKECMKYKETIHQLTDPETSDIPNISHLNAKIDSLLAEKQSLEEKIKTMTIAQTQDDSIKKCDVSTITEKIKQKMLKGHTPIGLVPKTLSVTSCNAGDTVLILWDGSHCNYTILQESPSLYLLHNDSLADLDLKIHVKDESERRLYAVGKVENKEYCNAVKSGNKYQVAIGKRFYRVKVKPVKSILLEDTAYCCDLSHSSKDNDSSHGKLSRMTMSETASSYDLPIKKSKDFVMSKSVHPSQMGVSTHTKISGDSIEEENSSSKTMNDLDDKKVDEKMRLAESFNVSTCAIIKEDSEKQFTKSVCHPEIDRNITVETVECVPYVSNHACVSDQISEIAEEATP